MEVLLTSTEFFRGFHHKRKKGKNKLNLLICYMPDSVKGIDNQLLLSGQEHQKFLRTQEITHYPAFILSFQDSINHLG
jgi:hypothetical protein